MISHRSTANKAPAISREACPRCGEEVDAFRDPWGVRMRLQVTTLPITDDLTDPQVRHRTYEWRGPYVGWCPKNTPVRTWRELRLTHQCRGAQEKEKETEK